MEFAYKHSDMRYNKLTQYNGDQVRYDQEVYQVKVLVLDQPVSPENIIGLCFKFKKERTKTGTKTCCIR